MSRLSAAHGELPARRAGDEARYPLRNCSATIERVGAARDPVTVAVMDIGPGGVGVISPIALRPDVKYELWFASEGATATRWPAQVAWNRALAPDRFRVGISLFAKTPNEDGAASRFEPCDEPSSPKTAPPSGTV